MRSLMPWMGLVVVTLAGSFARGQEANPLNEPCRSPLLDQVLIEHAHARQQLDVHGLALVLGTLCPNAAQRLHWRLLDALALEELDEVSRARAELRLVIDAGPSPWRSTAAVLLARSFHLADDREALSTTLARLPDEAADRLRLFVARDDDSLFRNHLPSLSEESRRSAVALHQREYRTAMLTRRPWLAGALSAVVPGTGQAYAGSWQGALVAFALNSALIGATIELAIHRLYFSAVAAGTAGSIFYVGNILNAADMARRRNETAAEPSREALERLLIPEAYP